MADMRCPMCGHKNPEGTLNCENCDARLVPMGSIGGVTPPVEDANQVDQDDLGILLDDLIDEGVDQTADPLDSEILSWLDEDQPERKGDVPDDVLSSDTEPVEDRLSSMLSDIEPPLDEKMITDWLDSSIVDDQAADDIDEDWLPVASEDLGVTEESTGEDLLPSWLEEVESADGQDDLTASIFEAEEEEDFQPDWMTEASAPLEEPASSNEEKEASPLLPDWISDVPAGKTGELNVSAIEEDDGELPQWFTQELDSSVLEEEAEDQSGLVTQESHVSADLPSWMDDFSDAQDEDQEESDFDLPVSGMLTESSTEEEDSSSTVKKVTTSNLPWVKGVSEEEEEPDSIELPVSAPTGTTSILDRFSDTLNLETPDSVEESDSLAGKELDDVIMAVDDDSLPDGKVEESSGIDEQPAMEAQIPQSADGVSVEDLLFEEEVPDIELLPKENYADAVPEEEGEDTWSGFLGSDEFAPAEDELPDWFAQTTDGKTPSDLLRDIGADENPDFVPAEEEPEEEQPEKEDGSLLGILKGIRKPEDEQEAIAEVGGEEISSEEVLEDTDEDWDLPDWVVADESPVVDEPTFEITDALMDDIQDAVPDSELPDWLAEAEDKPIISEVEEPVVESEPSFTEEPVDEISEQGQEMDLDSLFEEIESPAEETPFEEMVDGLFEEEETTAVESVSEDAQTKSIKAITDALTQAGLPEWLDDNITVDDSGTNSEEELTEQPKAATQGLPQFMDDDMEFVDIHQVIDEEDELTTEVAEEIAADAAETAVLPEWLSDMPVEEPKVDETEEPEAEIADTTGLPDWLSDMSDEEPETGVVEEPAAEVVDTTGLPDWLSETSVEEAEAEFSEEQSPIEAINFEAFPDSLDEFSKEQPIDSDLDDVLAEAAGEVAEPLDSEHGTGLEEAEEDAIPEWMLSPEASHGQTGDLLDNLETGTLPALDDLDETSEDGFDDLPDWLTSGDDSQSTEQPEEESFFNALEIPSDILSEEVEGTDEEIPLPDAATVELGDIAVTQDLPDWLSEAASEEDVVEEEPAGAVEASADDLPVELADFISSGEELPDWMETIAAEEEPELLDESAATEGEEVFESIFESDEEIVDLSAGDLETEDEKPLMHPGATAGLPDWLLEYGEEDGDASAPVAGSDELDDWLVAKDAEDEEIFDLFAGDEEQEETLEPVIVTDTGELNTWIEDHGIQPEDADAEQVDQGEVISIDVEKDLPDWVMDLEPEEVEPEESEATGSGTASLPQWMESDEEPEIESAGDEIELPPMEEGLFDFISEEVGEEESEFSEIPMSLGELTFDESPELEGDSEFDAGEFDMSSFEAAFSEDDGSETAEAEFSEETAEESMFDLSAMESTFEGFSVEEDEESSFDIGALESMEENYTPDVGLEEQSDWLGDYAEQDSEEIFEEAAVSASPFSISLEDEELAEAEGVSVAEELPEWVDKLDSEAEGEEGDDLWDQPLEAMAAISSSVQTSFDQEQPDVDHERRNIELMERILLSEKGTAQTHRPRRRTRELTLRLMLTVLVIVAVLAGLYSMMPPLPNFVHNAPTAVVQFEQQIRYYQQVASDKPVLVVFDYQPAYQGEMMVYAELPLKSLMENNSRIFTFSTIPEGPALSQTMMMDVVFQNGLQYNTQSQAVPLGYLPGGSAAIRDFSLSMRSTVHGLDVGSSGAYIWDLPMTSDVDSLDDFAMVLVLTDDLDKARLWIEQATIYMSETTPMLMITSARISAMLKPYLLSQQLDGLIGGTVDTAAYGTLANQVGSYIYYWRAYQLGIYLMVFTIIAGAVLQILRQIQRALPKRGDK